MENALYIKIGVILIGLTTMIFQLTNEKAIYSLIQWIYDKLNRIPILGVILEFIVKFFARIMDLLIMLFDMMTEYAFPFSPPPDNYYRPF